MQKLLRFAPSELPTPSAVAGITLLHVTKRFPGFEAVSGLSLTIPDGEFLVLVGPSGCGKTTVLRMIAGLEAVTEGSITIGDVDVTSLPPKARDVAMVFQDYALYPHLTVEKNIGIGLKLRGVPKRDRGPKVTAVATLLGLEDLLDRRPAQLSGGQRQRVAIGRAMVREPRVYLMDEPLSNLDAKLRVQMRAELGRLRDRMRVTTVYVTHDQVEAMTLGHRVAVLNHGALQQIGTPQDLFDRPANTFVAGFIGSPEMNLVRTTVADRRVLFAGHSLTLPEGSGLEHLDSVIVGIRPHDFHLAGASRGGDAATMTARPDVIESLGTEVRIVFRVDAPSGAEPVATGSAKSAEADVTLLRDRGATGGPEMTFTACLREHVQLEAGRDVDLSIDPQALHFFDPRTGLAIGPRARADTTLDG